MAQISLFEGPHLVYQQQQAQLINAKDQDNEMSLSIETLDNPETITVYKPGDNPVTFTVPLKSQISTPAVSYPKPSKLLAISDVEGNFNTVTRLLKNHNVIDAELNWSFGDGHFVIIGDVFDRGNHVTELLWLLYRMEDQAKAAGGMLHMLIGNHEMMNLQNDLRYVEPKYIVFDELLKSQTSWVYADMFGPDSELGRWVRSKNIVEKIGERMFTHGGMSPLMSDKQYSLEFINQNLRGGIDVKKADRNPLQKELFGRNGPMWYRGYFMSLNNSPAITAEQLDKMLNFYNAKGIAVGHTIVDKPETRFDGKVVAVDVKHPADHLLIIPPRQTYAVLFENEQVYVLDGDGGVEPIENN